MIHIAKKSSTQWRHSLNGEQNAKWNVRNLLDALKSSGNSKDNETGKKLHFTAVKTGNYCNTHVKTAIIDMYAKCGRIYEAHQVFNEVKHTYDVVTWNVIISGYVENGEGVLPLKLFTYMQHEGIPPNARTFLALITACSCLAQQEDGQKIEGQILMTESLQKGMEIHSQVCRSGLDSNIYIAAGLVDMYAKCGSTYDARKTFDTMKYRDEVSWNSVILGYIENGKSQLALELFKNMPRAYSQNERTFVIVLKACYNLAENEDMKSTCLVTGVEIHRKVTQLGYNNCNFVGNALVGMYGKCGSLRDAERVFWEEITSPDVVSWSTLILAYVENGQNKTALETFEKMQCAPNGRTFVAVAGACGNLADEERGTQVCGRFVKLQSLCKGMYVHSQANSCGLDHDIFVGSSLVELYAKCRSILDFRRVFDTMKNHDVVSWTALVSGYVKNGEAHTAFEVFTHMQTHGNCFPDLRAFTTAFAACSSGLERLNLTTHISYDYDYNQHTEVQLQDELTRDSRAYHEALTACGSLTRLETGKRIQAEIYRKSLESTLSTSLIEFYGRCGLMVYAQHVFDSINVPGMWSKLISGYSYSGDALRCLEILENMLEEGQQVVDISTLGSILVACSRAGLVDEGKKLFMEFKDVYGVLPSLRHYTIMVDMLARKNLVHEAVEVLENMPFNAGVVQWMCVLSACCKWGNVSVGKAAFDRLLQVQERKKIAGAYELMANILVKQSP